MMLLNIILFHQMGILLIILRAPPAGLAWAFGYVEVACINLFLMSSSFWLRSLFKIDPPAEPPGRVICSLSLFSATASLSWLPSGYMRLLILAGYVLDGEGFSRPKSGGFMVIETSPIWLLFDVAIVVWVRFAGFEDALLSCCSIFSSYNIFERN